MPRSGDLAQRRATLEDEWSRVIPGLTSPGSLRRAGRVLSREVADSWARSLASVDPARTHAPESSDGAAHHRWNGSPLRGPVDGLADELRSVADDAGFVTAVTDASGTILWTCGGRTMRRRAERVNFAPGGRWDEEAMGTNALSLALRTGRPSTVFSAEHLVTALHGWVCYCAPSTDPTDASSGSWTSPRPGTARTPSPWPRCAAWPPPWRRVCAPGRPAHRSRPTPPGCA